MTCKECKFWEPIVDEPMLAENNGISRGTCHRLPPTVTTLIVPEVNKITQQMIPQIIDRTAFPVTMEDAWCGEAV